MEDADIKAGVLTNTKTQRLLLMRVPRSSLKHARDTGLYSTFSWVWRLLGVRLRKRVAVQPAAYDRSDSVFYAPFPHADGDEEGEGEGIGEPCETEFVTTAGDTRRTRGLVARDDDFELSFVGMHVPSYDYGGGGGGNELLLYSVRDLRECGRRPGVDASAPTVTAAGDDARDDDATVQDPNGIALRATDVPYIHYDPTVDGHTEGSAPDTFVPVPSSKALVQQHLADHGQEGVDARVSVRFTVMEIDRVTDEQARGMAQMDQVSSMVKQTAASVPYVYILSSAVSVANSIGKSAINKYACPDHVMSKDMDFRLIDTRDTTGAASSPAAQYAAGFLRVSQTHTQTQNTKKKICILTERFE